MRVFLLCLTIPVAIVLLLTFFVIHSVDYLSRDNGHVQKIYVILMAQNDNEFWQEIERGARSVIMPKGVSIDVSGPKDESDDIEQAKLVRRAVDAKADAIVIAPVDSELVAIELRKALSRGIKVVYVDSEVKTVKAMAYVSSNNYEIGRCAAWHVLARDAKNVLVVRGRYDNPTQSDRTNGFEETLNDHGINICGKFVANSDRKLSHELVSGYLKRNMQVDYIYATNDEMALGAAMAVSENDMQDRVRIVGVDATNDALKAICIREMEATVAQYPYEMGKVGVEVASRIIEGKEVSSNIYIRNTLVL